MKESVCIILCTVLVLSLFCGCGEAPTADTDGKLSIVATIFPVYDWTKNILGTSSSAEVTMLLDSGVDLHSFQPNADDIIKISTCDVFIYVGGESDGWVDDALKEAVNEDMIVVDLMDVLGDAAVEEEEKEGMEDHDHYDHDNEIEYDEHIWLSVRNAELLCSAIADALCSADSANADTYLTNLAAYNEKLLALEVGFSDAASSAECGTLLFCDRFPFRYLLEDYGIDYYAAFSGCSAETEASFETVSFLASKADELGLEHIIILEGSDGKIASTVSAASVSGGHEILTMDSMQSTTGRDAADGASYISAMEKNLETFRKALS